MILRGVVEDLSGLRDRGPGFKTRSRPLKFTKAYYKTQAICYSTVKITQFPDIVLYSTIVPIRSKVMNLGIYFDSFLNWGSHINHIISTIFFKLRKLY